MATILTSTKTVPELDGVELTGFEISNDDYYLPIHDGTNLKKIHVSDLLHDTGGSAGSIVRGKNLGTSYTTAQKADINTGKFKLVKLGDYWTINSRVYRVVSINYYLNSGDTRCTTPHVVVMPDKCILSATGTDTTAAMNDTNTTAGGFVGSKMYTTTLPGSSVTGVIESAFGAANILSHREILDNATNSGSASGWGWYDVKVTIPNECQIYGHEAWGVGTLGDGYNIGNSWNQFTLFALAPHYAIACTHSNSGSSDSSDRENYWLRDVVSSAYFAGVTTGGLADVGYAASTWVGVRPYFLLY